MIIIRRVLLLVLIAVAGIAVLAPLSARSLAELPDVPSDQLLVHRGGAPRADTPRGGILSARGQSVGAATGPEAVAPQEVDAPVPVPMEATLFAVPVAASAPVPAAPRPTATFSGGSVWDALAKCESGGNWAINTGNGYYGGLQFSLGTWNGYGGAEFAAYPHEATRDEQIVVAERLRAARGYQPWPACRAKLGLP